jgi:membrane associated rhomboid family serine protease
MSSLPPDPALDYPVAIYRSRGRPACDERAFVLHAVGIFSQVVDEGVAWALLVSGRDATVAVAQLRRYDRENPPRRRTLVPPALHAGAWVGSALYAAVLVLVAWLAGQKAFATDWLDAGALVTPAVRDGGEFWRPITALTLHFDVAHLLGNLGFGAFFGWLAGQLLGPGIAWSGAVAAAAAANLLNASVQPADHVSAGASTAVFAMLGLMSAFAWRRRAAEGERWAYRWAPLVAGVVLLGFTGAGGERTDVLAHLTGFAMGAATGWLLAQRDRTLGAVAQWSTGGATLAAIGAAWWIAIAA